MIEQQIRFCTSADGTRIAYGTLGEGPPVGFVWPWTGALAADFEHPEIRANLEGLARGRMLLKFDRRGVGASQREVDDLSLKAHVADLAAVVDHLGLKRFDLIGAVDTCAVTIVYATQHPERVGRLILQAPYACGADRGGLDAVRNLIDLLRSNWSLGRRMLAAVVFPKGPVEAQRWFSQMLRESASPETLAGYLEYDLSFDIRGLLPQLQSPTLILHRRRNQVVPISAAQNVAALIPNARFVLVDGDIVHGAFDGAEILRLQNAFLDEDHPARPRGVPSALVTVLFTDMAESTSLTRRLGDARAQELLRAHNTVIRDALKAHGGTEIKHTGDGIMASFGSASRALECAIAIQRALAEESHGADNPINVRIGLNAGEPVAEDQDLFGTAVQLAARVCAHAQPGQILAANVVRELAAGKGFLFSDQGGIVLCGFEDPVRLYELRWGDES